MPGLAVLLTAVVAVPCSSPGEWARTPDAAWVARVVHAAGYTQYGCTGSALVVGTRGRDLYVWSSRSAAIPRYSPRRTVVTGVEVQHDRLRAVWRARGRNVWVEAGPTTRTLPPLGRLRRLVTASLATR